MSIDLDKLIIKEETPGSDGCPGIFFRCEISNYIDKRKNITQQVRWKLLKKRSCLGCKFCDGGIYEDIKMSGSDVLDYSLKVPYSLENGAVYRCVFVPGGRDIETGYLEDWEWEMIQVEDET